MKRKVSIVSIITVALMVMLSLLVAGCISSVPSTATSSLLPTGSTVSPAPSATVAAVFLEISQPEDNSFVTTNTVQVKGRTLTVAVVSVQGNVVDVDSNGNFSATVALDEGPNMIEVIASDEAGNEVQNSIVVTFERGG